MILWIRARRVAAVLGTGLVLIAFAAALFTDVSAPLVSWTVSHQTVPVLTFAPLILAATLALCLESRLPEAELTSIRPVPILDTLLITTALAGTLAITGVGYLLTHADEALVLARNTVFLTGLMLAARSFTARGGIVVATGWVLVVILVGHRTPTEFFSWAVTGLPIGAWHATIAAVVAITLGVLLTYLTARKLP
ncbi:hypothetical protein [Nocardioides albus]|uniref:Uncharacterized protein n=1 Tax=Nocardioides albus TaxID=1841 RepID=A0A7W5F6K2_9ACTN|nr:hypothetical protein [Nocardioides albus]MBB3087220.1 hypothetical protein [Nocardioides albus]GGU07485.1 hypothetical protein GCM10007979_01410 [Nocardioides albus]